MAWFDGFVKQHHEVAPGVRLRARIGGRADAPPLLLLHGFPQTGALWHRVAVQLAPHYRLVIPDLRGYGESSKPAGEPGHANYSKRTMAADVHALMQQLGHARYLLAGHDRGGVIHALFDAQAAWQRCCAAGLTVETFPAGHYLAEEMAGETAARLATFFAEAA